MDTLYKTSRQQLTATEYPLCKKKSSESYNEPQLYWLKKAAQLAAAAEDCG